VRKRLLKTPVRGVRLAVNGRAGKDVGGSLEVWSEQGKVRGLLFAFRREGRKCIMGTYRLVLADDHALFLQGLKQVLQQVDDLVVIGEAVDGRELLDLLTKVTLTW